MQEEHGFETIWLVTFIALILALIVGTLGGYYYSQKNAQKITSTPTVTSTTSTPSLSATSSSQVADPTLNWKIYTNSVDKYSMKYPKDWVVKEDEGSTKIQNSSADSYIAITITDKQSSQTLLEYLKSVQFKGENAELILVKINGLDGLKLSKVDAIWPALASNWVANGNEVVYFGLNVANDAQKEASTNTYNQMLGTFQFTK